jgi:hypothetical protein
MPHPITPIVIRFEGAGRPVWPQTLPGNTAAAPAAFRNERRVKPDSGFLIACRFFKVSLRVPSVRQLSTAA